MKAEPTLICIPDISGFTQFMSNFDFELASRVVPSLLNNIIYSNEIGLKVSEIEGDAVLFYHSGPLPKLGDLINQCKYFYTEFYKQLDVLKQKHNEKEGSEQIPAILGLKIILHFGQEIGLVNIDKRIKLIGEDVIAAHKLLKNDIPLDEYVLFSHELMAQYKNADLDDGIDWGTIKEGFINDDHLGDIKFHYIELRSLVD